MGPDAVGETHGLADAVSCSLSAAWARPMERTTLVGFLSPALSDVGSIPTASTNLFIERGEERLVMQIVISVEKQWS